MTVVLIKVLCDVIYSFQQCQWVLSKKWVNGAIFSSHCAPFLQTSKGWNSGWNVTQLHWTNIRGGNQGARLAGKWGELFIWFQTSPACGDEKLREGWGGFASWIGFDKLGTRKICRALCSKVGFCFIISKSRCLRGYLVVIPPHFPGFSLILPFIPKEITWKGSVCCLLLC